MKRHAYLIIAHHEFPVLHRLLRLLDDERNDIYVHFDKKIASLPLLTTEKSNLYILENRIDVRWGNVSQIQAELNLFECAFRNNSSNYLYFHLISGVHIPLKSQDFIHSFFQKAHPWSVIAKMPTSDYEVTMKLRRFNILTRYFVRPGYPNFQKFIQLVWKVALKIQKISRIKINVNQNFSKASNWVSLTEPAVAYLIQRRAAIIKKYRYSLCGDEFFVPSELALIDSIPILEYTKYLKNDVDYFGSKSYTEEDLQRIVYSDCMFARKFNSENLDIIEKLVGISKN